MKVYKDKNNNMIEEGNFILLEEEKVCQTSNCDDGTLLYEELRWDFNRDRLELSNKPNYPDSYESNEIEIIKYNDVVLLLRDNK